MARVSKARAAELNALNKAGAEFVDILNQMKAAMKAVQESAGDTKGEMNFMASNMKEQVALADKLANMTRQDLADKRKRNAFDKALAAAKDREVSIISQINAKMKLIEKQTKGLVKSNKGLRAAEKQKLKILQDQLDVTREVIKEGNKFSKTVRNVEAMADVFGGIAEVLGDIPVLGKVFDGFAKSSKKIADNMAAGKSAIFAMGDALHDMAKIAAATFIQQTVAGINLIEENVVKLRRQFAMTGEDASLAFGRASSAAGAMSMPIGQAVDSLNGFNAALGTAAVVSNETATAAIAIAERMGLGADGAAKLYKFAAASGKSLEQVKNETFGFTAKFNEANGLFLNGRQILSDVAGASAQTALSTKKFPGGLKKAAAEARKLGTDLAKSESAMSNMLNFEESLSAEMEAEVLLGRELNLDKARLAALNNDIAGFNREIAKQGITAASFGDMNRLQQEAVAKAMGMTADELAGRLKGEKTQKALADEALKNGQKQIKSQLTQVELGKQLSTSVTNSATSGERLNKAFETLKTTLGEIAIESGALDLIHGMITDLTNFFKDQDVQDGIKAVVDFLKELPGPVQALAAITFVAPVTAFKSMTSAVKGFIGALTGKQASNAAGMLKKFGESSGIGNTLGKFFGGAKDMIGKGLSFIGEKTGITKVGGAIMDKVKMLSPGEIMPKIKGKFIKNIGKFIKGVPFLGGIIETLFAANDIKNMAASGLPKEDIYKNIGSRAIQAVTGMMGGAGAAALVSGLSVTGVPTFLLSGLAYAGGDYLGRKLGGYLAESSGMSGPIGKSIAKAFGLDAQINAKPMADFISRGDTITPFRKDDIVIGGTNLMGDNKRTRMEELLEELIGVVREGATVNFDSRAVGEALVLGATKY